eukprot:m.90244 g.90244  ORF g.90244 m.90244 type:complete len:221 (-) comp9847_c0_seq1:172-834(-)
MDFDTNSGPAFTPWLNDAHEPEPMPEIVVMPLPRPSSPVAPPVTYKATYLGATETSLTFPEPGQLSADEFRFETDNVLAHLQSLSKSAGEKHALKEKVVVYLNSDNVVEAVTTGRMGGIATVQSSLDDVMAYRAANFRIRGWTKHTAVLICRSNRKDHTGASAIVCHRFIFRSRTAQSQFFSTLQSGFKRIAKRMAKQKKREPTLENGRPMGRAVRNAWG